MHFPRPTLLLAACGLAFVMGVCPGLADGPQDAAAQPDLKWYKGNTHTHSLWSDGNDFPEMVVDWYRRHGYAFLALSDHNTLSDHEAWMSVEKIVKRAGSDDVMTKYRRRFGEQIETRIAEGEQQVRLKRLDEIRPLFEQAGVFLLIQAEEITDSFEKQPVHINALNLKEVIPPQHGDSARDTIADNLRAVRQQEKKTGQPILAFLNHPNWHRSITAEDLAHMRGTNFFEVYNGGVGADHLGDELHASDERLWDIASTIRLGELHRPPLFGVATDDAHHYHGRDGAPAGRGWVMVRAAELSAPAIITAMRQGDFYASSGVTLRDVRYSPEAKTLEIEIVPDGDAEFTTQFIGTRSGYDSSSEPVTDADGKALDVTRRYSADVGQVLATVRGTRAVYTLTGDELYVRATITANKPPDNPAYKGQLRQAWTQPVGWQRHVQPGSK